LGLAEQTEALCAEVAACDVLLAVSQNLRQVSLLFAFFTREWTGCI